MLRGEGESWQFITDSAYLPARLVIGMGNFTKLKWPTKICIEIGILSSYVISWQFTVT